jgi:hypothetical protein
MAALPGVWGVRGSGDVTWLQIQRGGGVQHRRGIGMLLPPITIAVPSPSGESAAS